MDQFHRDIEAAETAPCPQCGTPGGRQESHPATGTMLNCGCGVRSSLRGWLAGKIEYRRNTDGTYSRADI